MASGALQDAPVSLEEGLVYLVRARIQDPGVPEAELERVLSAEERQRTARYRFEDDRRRARVAWGLLRLLLARVLHQGPEALRFVRDEFKKPHIQGGPSFNLAHSGDWILIGAASGGRLGVDVEAPRSIPDLETLAQRVFAPDEFGEYRSYPLAERAEAFYRGWTRKEAFMKAVGGGLSIPLKGFSVSLAPGTGDVLRRVESPSESECGWWVRSLVDFPDAEAAVARDRPWGGIRWIEPVGLPVGP